MTALEIGELTGIITGTRVASRAGWCPIENVEAGSEVLTFDAGFQEVRSIERTPLWSSEMPCPQHAWPLEVPAGVLGNRDTLQLMPDQSILIEIDAAEDLFGDPFALIPVRALEGHCGVTRVMPATPRFVTTLRFDTEQIVFANSGAMFLCPSSTDLLDIALGDDDPDHVYTVLPLGAAQQLAALMGTAIRAEAPKNWPDGPQVTA